MASAGDTPSAGTPSVGPATLSQAHIDFGVQTKQFGLLSAGGAVVILVLLFALAYAESFARSLRKGKRSTVAMVGLAAMGALIGVAVVGLAWVLAIRLPTVATLVACAVLGAAAGAVGAVGSKRVGRQRRYGRAVRREQANMTSYEIDVVEPDHEPRRLTVDASLDVGRECDGLNLDDGRVSRRHLTLSATDDGLVVTDLGSTNGTMVNGVRIDGPTRITASDTIELGSVSLRLVSRPEPAPPGPAPSRHRLPPEPPPPRGSAARTRSTRPCAGGGRPQPPAPAVAEPPEPAPPRRPTCSRAGSRAGGGQAAAGARGDGGPDHRRRRHPLAARYRRGRGRVPAWPATLAAPVVTWPGSGPSRGGSCPPSAWSIRSPTWTTPPARSPAAPSWTASATRSGWW